MKKTYVIGAGVAGATAARILKNNNWHVEIFDITEYISGNCFNYVIR
jgi:hypothetical protein